MASNNTRITFNNNVPERFTIPLTIDRGRAGCDDVIEIFSNLEALALNNEVGLPGVSVLIQCNGCGGTNRPVNLPSDIPADQSNVDLIIAYDGSYFPYSVTHNLRIKIESQCNGFNVLERFLTPIEVTLETCDPELLDFTFQKDDITITGNDDGRIRATATGGSGSYVYRWTGPFKFFREVKTELSSTIEQLKPGKYTLEVIDELIGGNSVVKVIEIFEPIMVQISVGHNTRFRGSDGFINLTVTGGSCAFDYYWDSPQGPIFDNAPDLYDVPAGDYSLRIVDTLTGQEKRQIIVVKDPQLILSFNVEHVTYFGGADGHINLTVSDTAGNELRDGIFSYEWTGPNNFTSNEPELTKIRAGRYQVTVREFNSGTTAVSEEIIITEPSRQMSINFLVTNPSKFGLRDGTIQVRILGGSGEYDYLWSGPSINVENQNSSFLERLAPGEYNLQVVDIVTCRRVNNVVVLIEPDPELEVRVTALGASCFGCEDGSASVEIVNGTGPYRFTWSGNNIDSSKTRLQVVTGLRAGTYQVSVQDRHSTVNETVIITEPSLDIVPTIEHINSCGTDQGSISLDIINGVGPYEYEWSGPSINAVNVNLEEQFNLLAGIYTVRVFDAGSQQDITRTIVVREAPNDVTPQFNIRHVTNWNGSDGFIETSLVGTDPNITYDFDWADANGNIISKQPNVYNLRAGNYRLVITELTNPSNRYATGRKITNTITITEPENTNIIQIQLQSKPISRFGAADAEIRAIVVGGFPPYSYRWFKDNLPYVDPTQNLPGLLTNLNAGVYLLRVTDSRGYTQHATQEIKCFSDPCVGARYFRLLSNQSGVGTNLLDIPIVFNTRNDGTPLEAIDYLDLLTNTVNTAQLRLVTDNGRCCCDDMIVRYQHDIPGLIIQGNTDAEGSFVIEKDTNPLLINIEPPLPPPVENVCDCLNLEVEMKCNANSTQPSTQIIKLTVTVCITSDPEAVLKPTVQLLGANPFGLFLPTGQSTINP